MVNKIQFIFLSIFLISCGNYFNEKQPKEFDIPDYNFLIGKKICIDPGHQQTPDTSFEPMAPNSTLMKEKCTAGTIGITTNKPEYEINLEIALKLKNSLERNGAIVTMTRYENDVNISNSQRAEIGNEFQSDLMIRLHTNGSEKSSTRGISILIPGDKYIT